MDVSTIEVQENNVRNIETLQSDHKEADSRMFIYARYLVTNNQIGRITIASSDTDILIIACFHFSKSFFHAQNWFKTGNANDLRCVAVQYICKKYGATFCMSFPVVHTLTGYDSTSSFTDIGKKAAFKILKRKKLQTKNLPPTEDALI